MGDCLGGGHVNFKNTFSVQRLDYEEKMAKTKVCDSDDSNRRHQKSAESLTDNNNICVNEQWSKCVVEKRVVKRVHWSKFLLWFYNHFVKEVT